MLLYLVYNSTNYSKKGSKSLNPRQNWKMQAADYKGGWDPLQISYDAVRSDDDVEYTTFPSIDLRLGRSISFLANLSWHHVTFTSILGGSRQTVFDNLYHIVPVSWPTK